MTATVKWQAIEGKQLVLGAPSSFIEAMDRAFGQMPLELNRQCVPILRGLMAGLSASEASEISRAVKELIDALQTHETIRVWAEY